MHPRLPSDDIFVMFPTKQNLLLLYKMTKSAKTFGCAMQIFESFSPCTSFEFGGYTLCYFFFLIKGINPGAPHVNMTSETDGKMNDTEHKNGK
jgi:hypothetical protein